MNNIALRHAAIYGIFFFSGAAGLAYQVVWGRQLSLLFGVSIYALSAVLVAFLGGLGAGAHFFGKKLDEGANPIKLYASLEIALGAYVLAFPLSLAALERIYLALHSGSEGASLYVLTLRFLLAVLILAPPTFLMGGTLPALVRYFGDYQDKAGHFTGRLYSINTLGAMAGCIAAGFWLIEAVGLTNTLRVGAFINLLVGAIALGMVGSIAPAKEHSIDDRKEEGNPDTGSYKILLALFGVSGFCALSLELLWTRQLILLLNNTTYAFSLILAVFLFGIGAGSAVTARLIKKTENREGVLFGFFQMGVGFFALISLAGLGINKSFVEFANAFVNEGGFLSGIIPGGEQIGSALIFSSLVVFPCTFLMGGGMPLIVGALSRERKTLGGDVGRLYAVNTLGCVLGSLLAGYFFIPFIGIHKSILIIAWVAAGSGFYLLQKEYPENMKLAKGFAIIALIPLTALLLYKDDIAYLLSAQKLDAGSVVEFYEEGPSATVLVSSQNTDLTIGRKPVKRIWINGDPIAGVFREALQLERLQAHIPLLLHDNPKDALVICYGTGSTVGATALHGLNSVTAVDTSKEVFNASPYFSAGNYSPETNPAVKLVEEDGRNFLLTTERKFDFITSEPPPPSNAGIVSLYTKEYYELFRKRLANGGIVSQWIPIHHLSKSDFKMLVSSFVEVFPHSTMWYTKWDAIMIGSEEEIEIDLDVIKRKMEKPAVSASLEDIGVFTAHQLLSNFMMDKTALMEFVKGFDPLYDDRPLVEFSSPRLSVKEGVAVKGDNLFEILRHRHLPKIKSGSQEEEKDFRNHFESQTVFFRAQIEKSANRQGRAAELYGKALRLNGDNLDALYAILSLNLVTLNTAVSNGRMALGLRMLEDTRRLDRFGWFKPQLHFIKGMLLAGGNRHYDAEVELTSAIKLDENYFMAIVNLAGLYSSQLDRPAEAVKLFKKALKLGPTQEERAGIMEAIRRIEGK